MRLPFRHLLVAGLLFGSGCPDPQSPPPPPTADPVATPEVMVRGCVERDERDCLVHARTTTLTLWVATHAATSLELTLDDDIVDAQRTVVDGGVQLELPVPARATVLRLRGIDPPWTDPFELKFQRIPRPDWIATAGALVDKGDLSGAAQLLAAHVDDAKGITKLFAIDALRRVEFDRGRRKQANALTDRTLEVAVELGAHRFEAKLLSATANQQIVEQLRFHSATKTVDRLFGLAERDNFAASRAHYWAAQLDRKSGSLDSALGHLSSAHRIAARRGERNFLGDVVEAEAIVLGELGHGEAALQLADLALSLVRDTRVDLCNRLDVARNYAWTQLVLAGAGLPYDPPRPYLDEVLELHRQCPGQAWEHANAMVNLGLVELEDGHPDDALGWLAQIGSTTSDLRPWIEEIHARASYRSLDPTQEPSLLRKPIATSDRQLRWNALVRRADAAARWGFYDVARAGYVEAEQILEQQLRTSGTTSSAELFLAGRNASSQGLIELLLDRGQTSEALCAARLARGRAVAQLDLVARLSAASDAERAEWNAAVFQVLDEGAELDRVQGRMWRLSAAERELRQTEAAEARAELDTTLEGAVQRLGLASRPTACADLRTPADGELVLYLVPLRTEWVVFAATSEGLQITRTDGPALRDPQSPWLSAFPEIARAKKVVVVPTGEAWAFRIHEADFEGKPLIDAVPVVYSLDLPGRTPTDAPGASALVVGDPSENLPLARAEAVQAADALADVGWRVQTLVGTQADRAALEAALGSVSLLHYAGHGLRDGPTGWDSALLLGEGARLGVRDVMALPRVPSGVVLTGCDTASTSPNTLDGGMNLARAFVLAGSEWVVAADQEVTDEAAAAMGKALYRAASMNPSWARVLQRAQRDINARTPGRSSAAFRMLVP